jgi:hypothetical protein
MRQFVTNYIQCPPLAATQSWQNYGQQQETEATSKHLNSRNLSIFKLPIFSLVNFRSITSTIEKILLHIFSTGFLYVLTEAFLY